ncbi:trifunctional serine/threonine-protein kinase/ATP-binding protein/sensor histidine kinase [Paraburkholderia translucens]|nr:AAA family ATPase [Paraburkholderia sp. MMS20-SJTN17]
MKLMEKAPEHRYRNARSLLADLKHCESLLESRGKVTPFTLDSRSKHDRLKRIAHVPGRDEEVRRLVGLYRTVADTGRAKAAWVEGVSGIGKSTLIARAIACIRDTSEALMAFGKGVEAKRTAPYAVLVDAVEPLLQFVLGRPEKEFAQWRQKIRDAIGPASQTIATLLPAVGALLGDSSGAPQPHEISPSAERERVLHAVARLIASFASAGRPLVLVLDDLQWADAATLQVLERLLRQEDDIGLLFIGAFRSDEVLCEHPLRSMLIDAEHAVSIELGPLHPDSVLEYLTLALGEDAAVVRPLAQEIYRKTGGSPIFVQSLLQALIADDLLTYQMETSRWQWSVQEIAQHRAFADVASLLAHGLLQLPIDTLSAMQVLACLGRRASTQTLSCASGIAEDAIVHALSAAVIAGYVSYGQGEGEHEWSGEGSPDRLSDWFFTHDRVCEAAYAAMTVQERAQRHLDIVRRLLAASFDGYEVFYLAAQANLARMAALDRNERHVFSRLNHEAGLRAKKAMAHDTALDCFRAALAFADGDSDQDHADYVRNLRRLCGEAEFMTGALEQAESRLAALSTQAGSGMFGADVARLRSALYTALGRFDLALNVGLDFLGQSGIEIPRLPSEADVHAEYARLSAWLDEHGMEALRNLPVAADPLHRAITDIFADIIPPALYTNQNLVDFILLRATLIACQFGLSDASADVFVCMNQVLGERYGDYRTSRQFGELALHLVDARGLDRHKGRVYLSFGALYVPWIKPAREARDYLKQAFDITTQTGDHTFTVYCSANEANVMLFAGESLDDVREVATQGLTIARAANFQLVIEALLAQWQLLSRLQDLPASESLPAQPATGAPATLVDVWQWVYRLEAALIFGDIEEALRCQAHAESIAEYSRSFADSGDLPFYGALALLSIDARTAAQEATLQRYVGRLQRWAQVCHENFSARYALVCAEVAREAGRRNDASDGYARAVKLAQQWRFPQVEALAAEFATRFHLRIDHKLPAQAYARCARAAWQRWGATAKVRQFQAAYASLLQDEAQSGQGGVPPARTLQALDARAVLHIANALASDIVPARLAETLLRTALENAGADQGTLVVRRGEMWSVSARASVRSGAIGVSHASAPYDSDVLPVTLLTVVARTREAVVLDDARESRAYAHDDYIRKVRPLSVVCVPLMRHSELVGLLYLENNLVAGMFTPAKAAVLEVIASQAAFALENARLYDELLELNEKRARAEEQLRHAHASLARAIRLKAMGELAASIVHEVGQPLASLDASASAALRWLDRTPPEIGEARAMVTLISRSAVRARTIIQSLRDKARNAEPQFSTVDLADTLREAISLSSGQLEAAGITLRTHGMDEPLYVLGDRVQLQQVVINLLSNGAEAMQEIDAMERVLMLSCEPDERTDGCAEIRVIVEDTGCGIDPAIAERLPEPLFTTKATGMGMGLAISTSIVEAHGGTLHLSPRDGGGTRATFTLPLPSASHVAERGATDSSPGHPEKSRY